MAIMAIMGEKSHFSETCFSGQIGVCYGLTRCPVAPKPIFQQFCADHGQRVLWAKFLQDVLYNRFFTSGWTQLLLYNNNCSDCDQTLYNCLSSIDLTRLWGTVQLFAQNSRDQPSSDQLCLYRTMAHTTQAVRVVQYVLYVLVSTPLATCVAAHQCGLIPVAGPGVRDATR